MANIFLFVKYNGIWGENNIYKETDVMGILVPHTVTYAGLIQTLYEELQMSPSTHTISVKYETQGVFAPVKISNDRSLKAYLELKKNEADKTKFSLCLDIAESFVGSNERPPVLIDSPGVGSTPNTFVAHGQNVEDSVDRSPIAGPNPEVEEMNPIPPQSTGNKYEKESAHPPDDGFNRDAAPPSFRSKLGSDPTSDEGVNHTAAPSCSSRPVSNSESSDVYDIRSDVRIKLLGLYANKGALQRHLQMYAINNHFQFKAKVSHKEVLHVVCRDSNCKWAVRAVRLRCTHIFQIKR